MSETQDKAASPALSGSAMEGDYSQVVLEVSQCRGELQLSIAAVDDDGYGLGFRLCGPKFAGTSEPLLRYTVDERAAREIRAHLDLVFPSTQDITDGVS